MVYAESVVSRNEKIEKKSYKRKCIIFTKCGLTNKNLPNQYYIDQNFKGILRSNMKAFFIKMLRN